MDLTTVAATGTGITAFITIMVQLYRLVSKDAKSGDVDQRVNKFTSGLLNRVNILEKENTKLNGDLRESLESVGVLHGKIYLMSAQIEELQKERTMMRELLGKVKVEYDRIKTENIKLQEYIKSSKIEKRD